MAVNNKFIEVGVDYISQGFTARMDTTYAPGFRLMRNMRINSNGGIGNRKGVKGYGNIVDNHVVSAGSFFKPIKDLYSFRRTMGREYSSLIFSQGGVLYSVYPVTDYTSPTTPYWGASVFQDEGSYRMYGLVGGDTDLIDDDADRVGYKEFSNTKEKDEYLYISNKNFGYNRITGVSVVLKYDLNSSGTVPYNIPAYFEDDDVEGICYSDSLFTGTIVSSTTTSITVSTSSDFATDQWVGFLLLLPDVGGQPRGRIITGNTSNTISFDALPSAPATGSTCEIVVHRIPFSGKLYGVDEQAGDYIEYDEITSRTSVNVTSTSASAIPAGYVLVPPADNFNGAPRGSLLETLYTQMYVGDVLNGIKRDDITSGVISGSLAGDYARPSVYRSKLQDASDFSFSSPRAAGEGDIMMFPDGGKVRDLKAYENSMIVFKDRAIYRISYPSDTSDIPVIDMLSGDVGVRGRAWKGGNDLYFMSNHNEFTSLGRVAGKDLRPQVSNIGYEVERFLDKLNFNNTRGVYYKHRHYILAADDSDLTYNNVILPFTYDTVNNRVISEGVWETPANDIVVDLSPNGNDRLIYAAADENGALYLLNEGIGRQLHNGDVVPFTCKALTNWIKLSNTVADSVEVTAVGFEGYIDLDSSVTLSVYKDFDDSNPLVSFRLEGTESDYVDSGSTTSALGIYPLGGAVLGGTATSLYSVYPNELDDEGRRHFKVLVFFPPQHGSVFSFGIESDGIDNYNIIRMMLNPRTDMTLTNKIKL